MKALISPLESVLNGFRIADIHVGGFDVAEPFYWMDCADDVTPSTHYFDGTNIVLIPPPPTPASPLPPEPLTTGGPSVIAE